MLATHAISLSPHEAPKPAIPYRPSSSRPILADSTNYCSRPDGFTLRPQSLKRVVSSNSLTRRVLCSGPNDSGSPARYTLIPCHPRQHHSSVIPSPFQVTCKAPPTVSVSLSEACSQNGRQFSGPRAQGLETDLPDVRSVVPFPSTSLDGCLDVEMLDGTCVSSHDGHLRTAQTARKRRSAHSSVSSSQGNLAKKGAKDASPTTGSTRKRQRKGRKQVAEIWWLGVLHRSIMRGIEARQELDASKSSSSAQHEFDTMDRVLVEKIQKRLDDNGCFEGRPLPSPLPRISSPSISVPSLNLVTPIRKTPSFSVHFERSSGADQKLVNFDPEAAQSAEAPSSASPPITSQCAIPVPNPTSPRLHVHFETPSRSCESVPRPSAPPRRSPSPPVRTGSLPTHSQSVTLTMPQIVASLTLAHRERSRSRPRGRSSKGDAVYQSGEIVDRSLPPSQVVCRDAGDAIREEERMHKSFETRGRLSRAPERKSPLSRLADLES